MTPSDARFTLELPPDPAYVSTARLFASSLARHFEYGEEVVEDLMLAISEACSRALAAPESERGLWLSVARDDGRLIFEVAQGTVTAVAGDDTPTPSHAELAAGLSLELITALFEDAELVRDPVRGPVLRFSVR